MNELRREQSRPPGRNSKCVAKFCRSVLLPRSRSRLAISVPAHAQQDFKIGIVESLTGGFAGPARDTMDGLEAWLKARGLPGKKVVFTTLDDETNGVNAANAFRRLAGDPDIHLIYLFIPSSSAHGGEDARLRVQGSDHLGRRRRCARHAGRSRICSRWRRRRAIS